MCFVHVKPISCYRFSEDMFDEFRCHVYGLYKIWVGSVHMGFNFFISHLIVEIKYVHNYVYFGLFIAFGFFTNTFYSKEFTNIPTFIYWLSKISAPETITLWKRTLCCALNSLLCTENVLFALHWTGLLTCQFGEWIHFDHPDTEAHILSTE